MREVLSSLEVIFT